MALSRMELFVQEYLIDLNATQAAIRSGYSPRTAESQGSRLLRNVKVQDAIQKAMQRRSTRTEITADMVLKEYAKLGFSNITDYLSVEDRLVVVDKTDDGAPITDTFQSVRIFDTAAVDPEKMRAVAEIKQTKDGIALKLHDKKGALDSIARHLGMFNDKLEHSGNVGVQIINDIPRSK